MLYAIVVGFRYVICYCGRVSLRDMLLWRVSLCYMLLWHGFRYIIMSKVSFNHGRSVTENYIFVQYFNLSSIIIIDDFYLQFILNHLI